MLRATHSALRTGGPNCFYVITNAENLTDGDRRRLAQRDGNEHVEAPARYDVLMEQAGYIDIELTDVTPEYATTLQRWREVWQSNADAFISLVGREDYDRRIRNRSIDIDNARDGLLRRCRVYGVKP